MEAIWKRKSVRKFEEKSVEPEKIRKLLHAGMSAPTACNQREWEFVVVNERELLMKLGENNPYAAPAGRAPLVIIQIINRNRVTHEAYCEQDMGAVCENILLEATKLGLGSVWLGIAPRKERMEQVAQVLHFPEYLEAFAMLAIGYSKEKMEEKDRFDEKRVHYNGF